MISLNWATDIVLTQGEEFVLLNYRFHVMPHKCFLMIFFPIWCVDQRSKTFFNMGNGNERCVPYQLREGLWECQRTVHLPYAFFFLYCKAGDILWWCSWSIIVSSTCFLCYFCLFSHFLSLFVTFFLLIILGGWVFFLCLILEFISTPVWSLKPFLIYTAWLSDFLLMAYKSASILAGNKVQ